MTKLNRPLLILIAMLAWSAVALQLVLTTQLAMERGRSFISGAIQCLSYFTVLTNLLVAVAATLSLTTRPPPNFILSATAVYIFIVGAIYAVFLKSVWHPTGAQLWADAALHEVIPILYIVYWFGFTPKGALPWRAAVWWLIYPALYLVFNLLYGAMTGRYLYWFGDLGTLGPTQVAINAIGILGAFLVTGALLIAIDHAIGTVRRRAERSSTVTSGPRR